jgi:hypothetical protein
MARTGFNHQLSGSVDCALHHLKGLHICSASYTDAALQALIATQTMDPRSRHGNLFSCVCWQQHVFAVHSCVIRLAVLWCASRWRRTLVYASAYGVPMLSLQ